MSVKVYFIVMKVSTALNSGYFFLLMSFRAMPFADTFYDVFVTLNCDVFSHKMYSTPKNFQITQDFSAVIGNFSIIERQNLDNPLQALVQSQSILKNNFRKRTRNTAPKPDRIVKAECIRKPDEVSNQLSPHFTQKPSDFIETVQSLETGRKMFTCKFCGIQNSDRGNLGKHILFKHLSNVPMIKCNLCDYESKLKGNMKIHYMKKHKLPENMATGALN